MWYVASTVSAMKEDKTHCIGLKHNTKCRAIFLQLMNGLNGTTDSPSIIIRLRKKQPENVGERTKEKTCNETRYLQRNIKKSYGTCANLENIFKLFISSEIKSRQHCEDKDGSLLKLKQF